MRKQANEVGAASDAATLLKAAMDADENDPSTGIDLSEDQLTKVARLSARSAELDHALERLETQRLFLQDELDRVLEKELPDLFTELGVKKLELKDGSKVEIKRKYSAGIAAGWEDARRQAAFQWLRDNGHGDLIKNQFVLIFRKEDDALAAEFAAELEKQGLEYVQSESVHAGTLCAFVREQREAGVDIPLETLGAHIFDFAKITPAPKPRSF